MLRCFNNTSGPRERDSGGRTATTLSVEFSLGMPLDITSRTEPMSLSACMAANLKRIRVVPCRHWIYHISTGLEPSAAALPPLG